jgi:asparagine synthase (glutamine-hydrolysing)
MTSTLVRRGPDDAGFFIDRHVGLGMRRLSIIDVTGGQQPVQSNSGRYVAVFNGEIYNYRELREELIGRGFSFKSHGDGEVLVNMYEAFGMGSFNKLRGMFGLAIWDTHEQELLLVRDQLGIKPLFYSVQGDTLLFGSEIKSILAAMPDTQAVDAQAVDALLAYTYIPAPLTIWKAIKKLRPGHWLKWRDGRVSQSRYWDLLDTPAGPEPSAEELRAALDESVRAHLVSDVEVGAFLSGGLDSSTIVARMQQHTASKIRALSVRFATESHLFDETGFARQLRDACGFSLTVENLSASHYDAITDAIRAFDEPFADDSLMPTNAISAMAAAQLRVVLSGAGGDELFGGYNRYQGIVLHEKLASLPRSLRSGVMAPALSALARLFGAGSRKGDLVRRFATDIHRTTDEAYRAYITATPERVRQELLGTSLSGRVDHAQTDALITDHQTRAASLHPLKRAMYVDVCTYLPEDVLALSDRIGMWHSLEIRTPLADRVLAEVAFRFPPDRLVGARQKKVALREAVRDWLPRDILTHPKQGFEGPTASWFRADGATIMQGKLEQHRDAITPFLNTERVQSLLAEHRAGRADHAKTLFSALALIEWIDLYGNRIGGSS